MKKFFYFWFLVCALPVHAQVNLDQPVSSGRSDKLFRSTVDPEVVYYFPVGMVRNGEPVLIDRDSESSTAAFSASYSREDFERVSDSLARSENPNLKIRFLRPLSYRVDPGMDISPFYHPQVTILNDFGFDGATQFSLVIDSKKRMFRKMSTGLSFLFSIFSLGNADNVAIVRYEMNAQAGGVPVRMKTAVGVYVGDRPEESAHFSSFSDHSDFPQVLDDSKTGCWEEVQIGQFCFKN